MQFILPVSENGIRQRHSTTLHIMMAFLLFGIGIASEGLYWFTTVSGTFKASGPYKPFLFFGIACLLVSAVILALSFFQKGWLRKESNNLLFRILELVLVAGSSILFFLNGWSGPAVLFGLMSLVVIFAIARERKGGAASQIVINEQGVTLHPAAKRKFIPWKDIDAVLLRFGTLTIEYADNHLIQQSIDQPMPEQHALEAFCRGRVTAHQVERVADDW